MKEPKYIQYDKFDTIEIFKDFGDIKDFTRVKGFMQFTRSASTESSFVIFSDISIIRNIKGKMNSTFVAGKCKILSSRMVLIEKCIKINIPKTFYYLEQ
jgi:hypothetical protein